MNCIEYKGDGSISGCVRAHQKESLAIGCTAATAAVALGVLSIMTGFIPFGGWALLGTGGLSFVGIGGYLVYDKCYQKQKKEEAEPKPWDYTQAIIHDLFEGDLCDDLDYYPCYVDGKRVFPEFEKMTAPVMKEIQEVGSACLLIKLESYQAESADSETQKGLLTLINCPHWMQHCDMLEKPSFFREQETNCLVGEYKLFEFKEDKKRKFEQEAKGFALVKELLKNGEVTDLRGKRWKIAE